MLAALRYAISMLPCHAYCQLSPPRRHYHFLRAIFRRLRLRPPRFSLFRHCFYRCHISFLLRLMLTLRCFLMIISSITLDARFADATPYADDSLLMFAAAAAFRYAMMLLPDSVSLFRRVAVHGHAASFDC